MIKSNNNYEIKINIIVNSAHDSFLRYDLDEDNTQGRHLCPTLFITNYFQFINRPYKY